MHNNDNAITRELNEQELARVTQAEKNSADAGKKGHAEAFDLMKAASISGSASAAQVGGECHVSANQPVKQLQWMNKQQLERFICGSH